MTSTWRPLLKHTLPEARFRKIPLSEVVEWFKQDRLTNDQIYTLIWCYPSLARQNPLHIFGPTQDSEPPSEEYARMYEMPNREFNRHACLNTAQVAKYGNLSEWQIKFMVVNFPGTMLRYAPGKLTPEQVGRAAQENPREALRYAVRYLTTEQFDAAVRVEPWAALLVPDLLDVAQVDYLVDTIPRDVLYRVPSLMNDEQFTRAAKALPKQAYVADPVRFDKLIGRLEE